MADTPEFDSATAGDCLQLIKMSLLEDVGAANIEDGVDCTTDAIVPKGTAARAAFVSRAEGIVCGVETCKLAIKHFGQSLSLHVDVADGQPIRPQQTIAVLSGPAHDILTMERTCLNFMCRLSGISTLTHRYVQELTGTLAQIFDTRKTTPGWRRLEKYAVACGGGQNHRMGLFDAVMIKDNHLAFFQSQVEDPNQTIPRSIDLARHWIHENQGELPNGKHTIIQLEVDSLEQLAIGLQTDCDIILLDNMNPQELSAAVAMRNETSPRILLEASGGVNLKTIRGIAQSGVERISVGALTHSAVNFDIGLDWKIG